MRIILYICLLCIVFGGCKKYPEDKVLVHFRRSEHRLKKATNWKITEYKVNGADSLLYASSKNILGTKIEDIIFDYDRSGFSVYSTNCKIYATIRSNKKDVLIGHVPTYPITYPLFFNNQILWQIKRMDHTEFTIETEKNGKNYRITFEYS